MTTADRKTTGTVDNAGNQNNQSSAKGQNVLNRYRSFNYVFTLSALKKEAAFNPETYRKSTLDLVILKSGGKGYQGISSPDAIPAEDVARYRSTEGRQQAEAQNKNKSLIEGFNKESPGRFDMFIDNVEIETFMATGGPGGMAQPSNFSFDVYEPYSINGFVEALHVAAVSAGYPTYAGGAVFLLKIEFIGYPDGPGMPKSEAVDKSTRYFPVTLNGIEVTIDEKGTKYAVKAIAANERGFGNPGVIKKPVKISGNTVQSILQNLMLGLTNQEKEHNKSAKKNAGANDFDEYKIKFPEWKEGTGWTGDANKIGASKVVELLKDNTLYKFPDPGNAGKPTANKPSGQQTPTPEQNAKAPETYKLEPTNPVVQFAEGKNIHECITAIIKDSKYVRDMVQKLSSESEWRSVLDENEMVDYFTIRLEMENKETIDADKKRPYQIFTYVVTPYKLLYTRIPNYGSQQVDMTKLAKLSLREYDYIYTGKNQDVLTFKLNFNTLFFEAIPAGLGNPNSPPSRDAAARQSSTDAKRTPENLDNTQNRQLPGSPVQSTPQATSVNPDSGGQIQKDPYYALAQAMHSAITDSKGSMLDGTIDILGDPIYLVTGGIGNYNPKPKSETVNRETTDGEATFSYGEVLITINFRNPIDIEPLENGGRMFFDPKLIPFSGIYRVTQVKSSFKDGLFKQSLEVIRQPGQPFPTPVPTNTGKSKPTIPTKTVTQEPNADDAAVPDVTPAEPASPGQRPDELNLFLQQQRQLPSPGLPGQLVNFTAATGGLGGTISVSQVSGATPALLAGTTRLSTQPFGGVVPGGIYQPSQGIPIPARAAVGLQQQVLSPAGLINQIGQNIARSFGLKGVAADLASQIVGMATTKINRSGVIGSGIGRGATIQFNKTNLSNPTSYDLISNNNPPNITAVPTTGFAGALNQNTLAAVARLPDGGASLINNAGTNITAATQGTNADPMAVAGKFGINQSQLSGLSPNLQSKILDQVSSIASNVPAGTDLGIASAQGVNLRGLSSQGIANLPPTAPYTTAPEARPDLSFLNSITASGGIKSLSRAFGVNNISEVPQSQLSPATAQAAYESAPAVTQNPLSQFTRPSLTDVAILGAKLFAERKSLMGPVGIPGSLEGNYIGVRNQLGPLNVVGDLGSSVVSKFGSKSAGKSPLDKIMIR
jgi:hypothetical protein